MHQPMETVTLCLTDYAVSLQYMTDIASEFDGRLLGASTAADGSEVEYGFDGASGAKNARAFREVLNTTFVRRLDPGPDPEI